MNRPQSARDRFIVFAAKGFGAGYAPKAPGTFGSIAGIAWFALLLLTPNLTTYVIGCVGAVFASVYLCGEAERILGLKDPGSVVIDEIIALPICYLPYVINGRAADGSLPSIGTTFTEHAWLVVAGFILFRLFDILKPPPIYQIQDLPGGWGVTADDVLAGAFAAGCLALLFVWPGIL
ncbi:MAG: phosphatidylglycerophosphatase A [Verrucomicrobiae bacterium]|jgi:phosphatidylglycerophosphatase A|nr:phosphatidylglycerophosphatase A [Verrucomicrobiae bacterium]